VSFLGLRYTKTSFLFFTSNVYIDTFSPFSIEKTRGTLPCITGKPFCVRGFSFDMRDGKPETNSILDWFR
jgi:hypothetical protein